MTDYRGKPRGKSPNQVGAAWKRIGKSGKKYLFLKLKLDDRAEVDLGNVGVSLVTNNNKRDNSKDPDFVALLSTYNTGKSSDGYNKPVTPAAETKPATPAAETTPPVDDDPF